MKRILAAIDFSETAHDVIATVILLKNALNARLWVAHADDAAPYFYPPEASEQEGRKKATGKKRQQQEQIIDNARLQLQAAGIDAPFDMLGGPADEQILTKAREIEADLIVIGAHRHSRMYNFLFGDTGDRLINHAQCPVMVVPKGAQKA